MDQADLYDQFGNYMGPELESDEEEDDEQQNGYQQELTNVDQTSDMVSRLVDKDIHC
jgi:U5 small nuclear ribonucleoprotein component